MPKQISNIKENITTRINDSLKKAEIVRGTVAFWTIKPNFFSDDFIKLLQKKDSFYCVDYHLPTNLDALDDFVTTHKANLYLFNHRCSKNRDIHLLHSKMMLLDFAGDEAELWIGSHNMTETALKGKNVENTITIPLSKQSDLYKKTLTELNEIKKLCVSFESKDLDYYKTLQNIHNFQNFVQNQPEFKNNYVCERRKIFLVGRNIETLKEKTDTLLLLGDDDFSIKDLVFATRIVLHTLDIDSDNENILEAEIVNFGKISDVEAKSYEITFSERFIALRSNKMIPFVFSNQSQVIDENQLKKCKYFINLKIFQKTDLLSSINNITDDDIWTKSSLNNGTENEFCDEIFMARKAVDLTKSVKNADLKKLLEKKLLEKIKNTQEHNSNNREQKTIPFFNYKTGLFRMENYLKTKFNINDNEEKDPIKSLQVIIEDKKEELADLINYLQVEFEIENLDDLYAVTNVYWGKTAIERKYGKGKLADLTWIKDYIEKELMRYDEYNLSDMIYSDFFKEYLEKKQYGLIDLTDLKFPSERFSDEAEILRDIDNLGSFKEKLANTINFGFSIENVFEQRELTKLSVAVYTKKQIRFSKKY